MKLKDNFTTEKNGTIPKKRNLYQTVLIAIVGLVVLVNTLTAVNILF